MEDEIEYPPKPKADVKFQSKHQCSLCARPLPFSPFSGIGWRDVSLDGSKQRQRICNECYITWRKSNPPKPHEANAKLWNRIILVCGLLLALYALWSFATMGITNYMRLLTGPGLILIVGGLFLYIFHGIINKRLDFAPPTKPAGEKKKKWEFRPPDNSWQSKDSPFRATPVEEPTEDEIPTSIYENKCDVCGLEKADDEVFTHPDGFQICNDCIARKKHYETNHN